MPSRNLDAGFRTQKMRAQALRAFYDELQVGYANGTTIQREQPILQSSRIIAERNEPFAFTAPFILAFSPSQGPVGTLITITGLNLAGPVKINGALATIVSNNGTTMTVLVPEGATTGPLTLNGVQAGIFTITGGPQPGASFYLAGGSYRDSAYSSNIINWSTDGSNWNPVNTTFNTLELFNVVTNGSDLYVTYGIDNFIYCSSDSSNWTNSFDFGVSIGRLKYVNGKIYALGTGLPLLNSTDGSNWSSFITSGDIIDMYSIEYGNGIYVAAGIDSAVGNKMYASTDGSNWGITGNDGNRPEIIVFGNNTWIRNSVSAGEQYYSTDGSNWTLSVGLDNTTCLTYGNGVWVGGAGANSNLISTDGSNWNYTSFPSNSEVRMQNVVFDGTKFIGTAGENIPPWDRTHMVQISTDGSNWTPTPDTNTMFYVNGITYNSGTNRYVMTGYVDEGYKSAIETSSNTSNWTSAHKLLINNFISGVTTNGSNTYLAAVGDGTEYLMVSTDSSNWNPVLVTDNNTYYFKPVFINGKFYACGYGPFSQSNLVSSTDGSNWNAIGPTSMEEVDGFAYGNGLYVLTGWDIDYTNPVSFTSTDGSNWDSNASYFGNIINNLTFANNLWVGCAYGSVYTSTDGSNWDTTTAFGYNATYGNGVWVTAAEDNPYSYSIDNGVTWTDGFYLTNSLMFTVHFDGSIFIAGGIDYTGGSQTFQTSSDGINWTAVTSSNAQNFYQVRSITSK